MAHGLLQFIARGALWRVMCYSAWCCMAAGVLWRVVFHGAWCFLGVVCYGEWCVMAGGVLWRVVFYVAWCVMAGGVSWRVVCHGAFSLLVSFSPGFWSGLSTAEQTIRGDVIVATFYLLPCSLRIFNRDVQRPHDSLHLSNK